MTKDRNDTLTYFVVMYALIFICSISLLLVVVFKDCNKNTENYDFLLNMEKYPSNYVFDKKQVFVCLTTIPERLITKWFYENILRTLEEIDGTNITLFISIPFTTRKSKTEYVIPEKLLDLAKDNENLLLNRCNDYGPITKLSGPLLHDEIADDSVIIICDDDQKYYKRLFINSALVALDNPYNVISPAPVKALVKKSSGKVTQIGGSFNSNTISHHIMGYQSFTFVKKLMKPILDIDIPESCFRIDDQTISYFMLKHGIDIIYLEKNRSKVNNYQINYKELNHPDWPKLKDDEIDDKRYEMMLECEKDFNLNN